MTSYYMLLLLCFLCIFFCLWLTFRTRSEYRDTMRHYRDAFAAVEEELAALRSAIGHGLGRERHKAPSGRPGKKETKKELKDKKK